MAVCARLWMVGDVMLARAIDMIQKHSCDPTLYEGNGLTAHDYTKLAIQRYGPIPDASQRGPEYVWGDTLKPDGETINYDVRIINLETAVTNSMTPWPRKAVNYKMHPLNVDVIKAGKVDCCVLANNHTVDWGFEGLRETLSALTSAHLPFAGAGLNAEAAAAPAVFPLSNNRGRVLVFSAGHYSSGVPDEWRAKDNREGVNIIDVDDPGSSVPKLKKQIDRFRSPGDVVVLSIHWSGNWEYEVSKRHRRFAQAAIKDAGVDIIHGHSSHHTRGVEVFEGKLILYGCGDFIDDYEGITGYEYFRGDLSLMYDVEVDVTTGRLTALVMTPTRIRHLRVDTCREEADIDWMHKTMSRECRKFGCNVKRVNNKLHLVF